MFFFCFFLLYTTRGTNTTYVCVLNIIRKWRIAVALKDHLDGHFLLSHFMQKNVLIDIWISQRGVYPVKMILIKMFDSKNATCWSFTAHVCCQLHHPLDRLEEKAWDTPYFMADNVIMLHQSRLLYTHSHVIRIFSPGDALRKLHLHLFQDSCKTFNNLLNKFQFRLLINTQLMETVVSLINPLEFLLFVLYELDVCIPYRVNKPMCYWNALHFSPHETVNSLVFTGVLVILEFIHMYILWLDCLVIAGFFWWSFRSAPSGERLIWPGSTFTTFPLTQCVMSMNAAWHLHTNIFFKFVILLFVRYSFLNQKRY